ncbi:Hydantoin utilization protein B [Pusillimonas sp. T7-7]|uniref:hydantoinase B/oxoprolinase family protein n=1 Tax=Pusillimonas sp. (strain T7-7) TaxID=1007105 RepID=UPI00020850AB|nr:hydantoinase B/oxoprolinase family protein [Pusillimonas sp. T7-7]AEC21276.1 Hydantoin utilization protein B [Pusillimonas sp. T7-7]
MKCNAEQIQYQLMWQRLIAIVEEQAQVLLRTAFSAIVRECSDLSAGVFDTRGQMLAQAVTGAPGHVNTMADSVQHFLRKYPLSEMQPGDVFITNDPWKGTGHLNDFVVVTPCFQHGTPVALFCATSHVMDIGGLGFGPDGTDVHMEGLFIPLLKLFSSGHVNETFMDMLRANTRQPLETAGDTYALAACNDVACERLQEMMDEFKLHSLEKLSSHILESSRAAMLDAISKLPEGSSTYSMTIDGYDQPIDLVATLTVSRDGILLDYAGTSPISSYGINVPICYATAYSVFGLACAVAGEVPNNSGSLSVFSVSAPEGCVLNALSPAPVSTRHVIGQMLPDVVFGCLRQIIPERVPAEGASCVWLLTLRGATQDASRGRYGFTLGFTSNGGTGARSGADGLSATAFPTNLNGTPVEIAETQAPLIFWRKELREGSGGAGRTRGGLGQVIEVQSTCDKTFEILASFDRINHPPRGRDGGGNGAAGFIGLSSGRLLAGKGSQVVLPGERLLIHTPGGGGIGDPKHRLPARVASDLADGLLTEEQARTLYGNESADLSFTAVAC